MLLIESDLNWSYSIILMEIFGKKFWGLITLLLGKKRIKLVPLLHFFFFFHLKKHRKPYI